MIAILTKYAFQIHKKIYVFYKENVTCSLVVESKRCWYWLTINYHNIKPSATNKTFFEIALNYRMMSFSKLQYNTTNNCFNTHALCCLIFFNIGFHRWNNYFSNTKYHSKNKTACRMTRHNVRYHHHYWFCWTPISQLDFIV